jgi:hypothetical protein
MKSVSVLGVVSERVPRILNGLFFSLRTRNPPNKTLRSLTSLSENTNASQYLVVTSTVVVTSSAGRRRSGEAIRKSKHSGAKHQNNIGIPSKIYKKIQNKDTMMKNLVLSLALLLNLAPLALCFVPATLTSSKVGLKVRYMAGFVVSCWYVLFSHN